MANLNNFNHSNITDIPSGKINNIDALLLLISQGVVTHKALKAGLQAWRRNDNGFMHYTYLFNSYYATRLTGADRLAGNCSYYNRISRGVYALTPAGQQRLVSIGFSA